MAPAPPPAACILVLSLLAFSILGNVPADFNGDGRVNQTDLDFMLACRTGPSVPVAGPPCSAADLDGDGDVDQDDFAILQRCWSGDSETVNPHCMLDLLTISGRVEYLVGGGVPGAAITASGTADGVWWQSTSVTGGDGYYSLTVPYLWSGTVSGGHPEYALIPGTSEYSLLTESVTDRIVLVDDGSGVAVSGAVLDVTGSGITGCSVIFFPAGGGPPSTTTTDGTGKYAQAVPVGWSGSAAPDASCAGSGGEGMFSPNSRTYTSLATPQVGQDYAAAAPPGGGSGRAIYVSLTGNDNWPGTFEQPFRTPQKAAQVTLPGDTVYIRGGTYTAAGTSSSVAVMRVTRSGMPGMPITFTAYPGETVVLTGQGTRFDALAISTRPSDQQYSSGEGVQHIVLEGLIVEGGTKGGISIYGPANIDPPTAHITVRRCIARYNPGYGIGTKGKMNNVLIEYCEAYQNQENGIEFGRMSKNFHVGEPEDDMNAASHSTIRHCLSYNNVHPATPGNTDGIGGSHLYRCTYEGNVAFDNSDDGMDIYASLEVTVSRNIVFRHRHPEGNGAGIKVSAGGGGNHLLLRNVSFDNKSYGLESSKPSLALLAYRASTFHHNLVYRTGSPALSIGDSTAQGTWVLHNNIAVEASGNIDFRIWSASNTVSNYNFWRQSDLTQCQNVGQDLNSRTGVPGFLNPGTAINTTFGSGWAIEQKLEHIRSQVAARFGLQSTSQCVNTGMNLGMPFNGSAPDIGAYERP